MQNLKLSTEWDKTFPKSEKVNNRKITFHNRYGITLAADMYIPIKSADKLAAIAVCAVGLTAEKSKKHEHGKERNDVQI